MEPDWLRDATRQRGLELNERYGRTDGTRVATCLHQQLEDDLKGWLYDRVFCLTRYIPESEWSRDQQCHTEIAARCEVSCFQSLETAIQSQECGYIRDDGNWLAEWGLKLNLGEQQVEETVQSRLSFYWALDRQKREENLSFLVSACLPCRKRLRRWVRILAPLLVLSTRATTARAFGDQGTYQSARAEFEDTERSIMQFCSTGGGECYVIESARGVALTGSAELGKIVNIWFDVARANTFVAQRFPGHIVTSMTFRELEEFLVHGVASGFKYVTVDRVGDGDVSLIPINDFISSMRDSIGEADLLMNRRD